VSVITGAGVKKEDMEVDIGFENIFPVSADREDEMPSNNPNCCGAIMGAFVVVISPSVSMANVDPSSNVCILDPSSNCCMPDRGAGALMPGGG
jgi:hypothetical protein